LRKIVTKKNWDFQNKKISSISFQGNKKLNFERTEKHFKNFFLEKGNSLILRFFTRTNFSISEKNIGYHLYENCDFFSSSRKIWIYSIIVNFICITLYKTRQEEDNQSYSQDTREILKILVVALILKIFQKLTIFLIFQC